MMLANIPDYDRLQRGLQAYLELDRTYLQNLFKSRFKTKKFKVIPDKILTNFIDNMSSLFTNEFDRTVEIKKTDDTEWLLMALTDAEQWCERWFHLFKKTALLIDAEADEVYNRFKPLTPLEFFYAQEINGFFLKDGKMTYLLIQEENTVSILEKEMDFMIAVRTFDTDKPILGSVAGVKDKETNNFTFVKTLPVMPIIEWSYKMIGTATITSLYDLEIEQEMSASWAMGNANTKQIHHAVMKTSKTPKDVKARVQGLGKNDKVTVLSPNDELSSYDAGSLDTLVKQEKTYEKIAVRKALNYGVDKHAISPDAKIESGTARQVALGYTNQKRKKFIFGAMLFEYKIFKALSQLDATLQIKYKGIAFRNINHTEDDKSIYELTKAKYEDGFISFIEAVAILRNISEEQAKIIIIEKGLVPQLLFTQQQPTQEEK